MKGLMRGREKSGLVELATRPQAGHVTAVGEGGGVYEEVKQRRYSDETEGRVSEPSENARTVSRRVCTSHPSIRMWKAAILKIGHYLWRSKIRENWRFARETLKGGSLKGGTTVLSRAACAPTRVCFTSGTTKTLDISWNPSNKYVSRTNYIIHPGERQSSRILRYPMPLWEHSWKNLFSSQTLNVGDIEKCKKNNNHKNWGDIFYLLYCYEAYIEIRKRYRTYTFYIYFNQKCDHHNFT